MIRSFLIAAALLFGIGLGLGAALAAPVLRAEITVSAPVVTVGDMFEDAGTLADIALFRAPAPGTTGTVSLEAVREAASIAGLIDYVSSGVSQVRVARASTLVDADMFQQLIVADMAARGIVSGDVHVETQFSTPNLTFNAEAVDTPLQLVSLRYMPGNGSFSARFAVAGVANPVDVDGRVELMVEAPHLAATRLAGAILAPEDIEMRLIPLRQAENSGIATLDQLVGKQLTRQSRSGMLLRPSDVVEPRVVERNAVVTVILNTGPMTLTVKGQALNAAAAGQPVQVLNPVSRKILIGTAQPNGSVSMTAGTTFNVAGL